MTFFQKIGKILPKNTETINPFKIFFPILVDKSQL